MALKIVRRIRDNLHGSIDISELEDVVLSHPYIQRLRRIKQLAFLHYVFPCATHTRFEHSLGVMHLAGVAWSKLYTNQKRLAQQLERYGSREQIKQLENTPTDNHGKIGPSLGLIDELFSSDYLLQTIRLAALMHDLGHPPFSHSGERFLPSYKQVIASNPGMDEYLLEFLKAQNPDKQVRHEIFSLLMIDKVLKDTYEQFPNLAIQVKVEDVISVVSSSIRPQKDSELVELGAYELIRELISGELDIDRMDYLLRDSKECGVVYGVFDAERILDSLCCYFDPERSGLHAAIHLSGLAAFEDYLRARQSMYLQLYFHKTAVGAEAMMQHLSKKLGSWSLPANVEDYARCDEYNVGDSMKQIARKLFDAKSLASFEKQVDDLLYERNLWKRVFEVSGSKEEVSTDHLESVEDFLEKQKIPCEKISSGNSLTRFRPREANEKSSNYLRLIKKDEIQFPRVVPIEDHSQLIASNSEVVIHRLYVASGKGLHGKDLYEEARRLLNDLTSSRLSARA